MLSGVAAIETERLVLRDWRREDKDPFAALNADPHVMEHFPSTLSREQSDQMVEEMSSVLAETGRGLWAAELKPSGEVIGFIGLSMPRWETSFTPCVEVGWRLAKHAWGQGYAPKERGRCSPTASSGSSCRTTRS